MIDLNQFAKWQGEKDSRYIAIKLDKSRVSIWAYDYILATGQFVKSADEIDLEGKKAETERKQYEALRKKFEGES